MRLTPEQLAAIQMAEDGVPCTMSMVDGCEKTASWLVEITHLGNDCGAVTPNPVPLCTQHKTQVVAALNPFWATFTGLPTPKCDDCGRGIRTGEVRSL